jgi:hypothetical protein
MNCETILLCRDNYCEKLSKNLTQIITLLEENKWECCTTTKKLHSLKMGEEG